MSMKIKKSRKVALETKNTQKNKNRRLGFIKSSYASMKFVMMHTPSSTGIRVFNFQGKQDGLNGPKENKNIISSMMK